MISNHEIDYQIFGEEMQCVQVELDPGESVIAEAGSFMMMDPDIVMETIFGDGSPTSGQGGLLGNLLNAGKRLLTGESLFMTMYSHAGKQGKRRVTFASPYPGRIVPLNLRELSGKIICQKDAFLCAAKGVSVGLEFQRRLGTGLFGGEGFIMQKLEGDGMAFMHAGGYIFERVLEGGETLRVDTGCLVAMTQTVHYDIEFVKGVRNVIFGGEGLFYATLTGPGRVWIQTLPISRLASKVLQYGSAFGSRKEEGGLIGGIGNILDGR
ncbi:MAG: TIGR00266 family protein [Bacteroidia bacterium]|nr:TIGR00266 family protein [Bacteroidia bacterium]